MKIRLDKLVQLQYPSYSRSKVQSLILQKKIYANDKNMFKPGFLIDDQSTITIKHDEKQFVSRGGNKLQKVFDESWIVVSGKVCADVGASTGGFTDCLLQQGATKVYAIDVGYGQLDHALRNDKRVVVMEKTNARHLKLLPEKVATITVDVSFISLRKILPTIRSWLKPQGKIITLFKPQFEADRKTVTKGKGVIKEERIRMQLLEDFSYWLHKNNFSLIRQTESPLKGPKGNKEYLLLIAEK